MLEHPDNLHGAELFEGLRTHVQQTSTTNHQASCLLQVVTAWNGIAISAFANASRILASQRAQTEPQFPVEGRPAADYLQAAQKVLLACTRWRGVLLFAQNKLLALCGEAAHGLTGPC
jgi:hypothetical protein